MDPMEALVLAPRCLLLYLLPMVLTLTWTQLTEEQLSSCSFLFSQCFNSPPMNSLCLNNRLLVSSVAQSCPTPCDPMECRKPGLPVYHQPRGLLKHVHQVGDAIQPSHPLSCPSLPAFNPSQHQGLLQWVSSSHQVAKVLEFQHQSLQWIFRTDFL